MSDLRKMLDALNEIDPQIDEDHDIDESFLIEGRNVREWTIRILEAMDDGTMDPRAVADAALSYLSESQVADMARANDWNEMLDPNYYEDEYAPIWDDPDYEGPYDAAMMDPESER